MNLLLNDARVVDGTGRVHERGHVYVEGAVIRRIGAGQTVLPGRIDCHVHLCLDAASAGSHRER